MCAFPKDKSLVSMMKQERLLTTIGIILFQDSFDNDTFIVINDLKTKLNDIGYNIRKITFITCDEQNTCTEIETSLKDYQFVIVLIESFLKNYIEGCLCKIFNSVNKQLEWKVLKDGQNNIDPVLYFQRVFVVDKTTVVKLFDNLLRKYFEYFIEPKPLTKNFKFKEYEELHEIIGLSTEKVKTQLEEHILTISSFDLESIVMHENKIKSCKGNVESIPSLLVYEPSYLLNLNKYQEAIKIIEECFQKYCIDNVCLCFNGGKDCMVLLHLMLMFLHNRDANFKSYPLILYIESKDPFPEIQSFIKKVVTYFNLKTLAFRGTIKEALLFLREDKPHIEACLMGTRKTDPYSDKLKTFTLTDPDWPPYIRISPLLDWHYSDVWDYLQTFQLPYCELYEYGYTSIGNMKNTRPNPYLLQNNNYNNGTSSNNFLPAYKLLKENLERNGRISNSMIAKI